MASAQPQQAPLERLAELATSTLGRWLLRGLGVALLLLVGGVVVRQARARVWPLEAYRLGPENVRYVGIHPTLLPLVLPALRDRQHVRFDVSVFDDDAETIIREVVARHPMVARVLSVQIRYPDRVDVRIVVREPAAWFEVHARDGRRGWVLVSTDARSLRPDDYRAYREQLRVPLPKVRGVRAHPPEFLGQAWEDLSEQVAEGIAAARVAASLYRDFNGTLTVETIDVSRFPASPARRRDGEIRFVLHDGTVVEWGRTDRDLDGVAGEDPYETKQWRLETERARQGGRGKGRIDVRFRLPGEGRQRGP